MMDHVQILQIGQKVQFAVTVSLNRQEIKKHPQRTKKKNQPVINKNNWEGRNFSSKKGD